ncbi:MAG: trypsin-like peptidase domain-containing protein [Candidatus Paceibacterota bacterium]|jgi:serine protease Do
MLSHKLSHLQRHVKDHKKEWAWLGAILVIVAGAMYFSQGGSFGFLSSGWWQNNGGGVPSIIAPYNNAGLNGAGRASSGVDTNQLVDPHEQVIVAAVKKATPAVVSIVISKDVPIIEQCPGDPLSNLPPEFQQFFGSGNLPQFYAPCQKGTKMQDIGGGSGFIVSSDGYLVTNKHVVSDTSAEYTVFTNDGKKYVAKVIARHPTLDLAVLKINATNLPTVELGDSNTVTLGQTAITIGYALGQFRNTISAGIISGLARNITASTPEGSGSESINDVIQTDAPINPGNSGGPLLNSLGQVIGINVAMVSGAQNIGFSIPINQAKKAIQSAEMSGKISVAYLGVRYVVLDPSIAQQYNVSSTQGALVKGDGQNFAVEPGSPASSAGLREGDVITRVDGKTLDDSYLLATAISEHNPGDVIQLTVVRDGKVMDFSVTLGEKK